MSPLLQRKLRAMSTALVILLSLAVAGALAWSVRRYETSLEIGPTPCSRVLDEVFAGGAVNTPDSILVEQLLEHRAECIRDAGYVDQARRLLLNTQQVDRARALLNEAERYGTFKPDELRAQFAWVDLTAAHMAWTNDRQASAEGLHAKAVSAASELRDKWPEWSLPYRILEEAGRAGWTKFTSTPATDYFQLERAVRRRILNGAFVRALTDWQPIAFVFVVAVMSMLGLWAGASGWVAMREMTRMTTSSIATAPPGYIELKGTLHLLPNHSAVIGPHSKMAGVWYELESKSGAKGARSVWQRSAQSFVLRDPSGEVVIEPQEMSVRTRHSSTKFGNSGGMGRSERISERLLKENDVVYALGEMIVSPAANGTSVRKLRIAENGRRLLVSNLSEAELIFIERLWFWIGTSIFVIMAIVLAWAYYQRYHVHIAPGVLP
jgi:hypothetical protein